MTKGDFDGIGIIIIGFGCVKFHTLRQYTPLDTNVGVLGDRVQEETLNPSLMKDNLLKPRDPRCRVWDPITALDLPVTIWVP
jgi:hypothetical protein